MSTARKATRMLTPCGGVQSVFRTTTTTTTTARNSSSTASRALAPQSARSHLLPCPHTYSTRRRYATETSPFSALEPSKHPSSNEDLSWPTTNPQNPYEIPTPYEIFKMRPSDPYSKRRFYELVKLYHPDRAQFSTLPSHAPLSASAKLERYRMVIAANELLSDARRRRLYDAQGIGWSGRPGFGPAEPRWRRAQRSRGGAWSGFDDNVNDDPRANATWEDWEAWQMRQSRTGGEQRPVYMSNGSFVVLIVVAAGLAGMGEATRMKGHSRKLMDRVEARHESASEDLMRRRRETQETPDRDEHLRRFLRLRGPQPGEMQTPPVGQEREGSLFVPDQDERQ